MDTIRINVPLTKEQAKILIERAEHECRHPREQARYLILRALGLLECETSTETIDHEVLPEPA